MSTELDKDISLLKDLINKVNTFVQKVSKLNPNIENVGSYNTQSHSYISPQFSTEDDPKIMDISSHHVSTTDKWIDDSYINPYITIFTQEMSNIRPDVLIINPSVTQCLKYGDLYSVTEILTNLQFDKMNFLIFCLNNYAEQPIDYIRPKKVARGAHWSLLIYSKPDNAVFHLDSLKGINASSADLLISNLGLTARLVEVNVTQQSSSFECGIHLLVNCKYIMVNYFFRNMSESLSEFITKNFEANEINEKTSTSFLTKRTPKRQHQISEEKLENDGSDTFDAFQYSTVTSGSSWSIPRKVGKPSKAKHPDKIEHFRSSNMFDILNHETLMIEDDSNNRPIDPNEPGKNSFNCAKYCNRKPRIKNTSLKSNVVNDSHDGISIKTLNSIYKDYPENRAGIDKMLQPKTKLNILSDSHGRNLAGLLSYKLPGYEVCGHVFPNATMDQLVGKIPQLTQRMGIDDILLIIGGTNDVSNNKNYDINPSLNNILSQSSSNKIIVVGLPYRYDKPSFNKFIKKLNHEINDELQCTENVNYSYMDLEKIKRNMYTKPGLHFNLKGKRQICDKIASHIKCKVESQTQLTLQNYEMPAENRNKNGSALNIRHLIDSEDKEFNVPRISSRVIPIPVVVSNRPQYNFLDIVKKSMEIT